MSALCGLVFASGPSCAADRVVRLATLEWPPYANAQVPDGGLTVQRVRDAYKSVGVELEVIFLPWTRAVLTTQNDPTFVGYFPEYDAITVRRRWLLSEPIGKSDLGFAEPYDRPVVWRGPETLSGMTVGVVQDYVNTAEIDARIASGLQPFERSISDQINLLKLANRRADVAIIDRLVFAWLMANDPSLRPYRGTVLMNAHLLEKKTLHVAFRRDRDGQDAAALLALGLKHLDATADPRR